MAISSQRNKPISRLINLTFTNQFSTSAFTSFSIQDESLNTALPTPTRSQTSLSRMSSISLPALTSA